MSKTRLGRRMDRVEGALALPRQTAHAEDDGRELATEVRAAFAGMVAHYCEHGGLTPEEARAKAANTPDHYYERILACDPSQVSWYDLDSVAQRDANQALERWEEIKRAARGEVASGHRAARALEGYDSHCWSRARFSAVRAELTASWRPRTAAEQHLIDQMAQWQTQMWHWLETTTAFEGMASKRIKGPNGAAGPPLQSQADALEQATGMVERFHRLYLRTQRALLEMRRLPPVVVRAAGQVNIGGQQVNVSGSNLIEQTAGRSAVPCTAQSQ